MVENHQSPLSGSQRRRGPGNRTRVPPPPTLGASSPLDSGKKIKLTGWKHQQLIDSSSSISPNPPDARRWPLSNRAHNAIKRFHLWDEKRRKEKKKRRTLGTMNSREDERGGGGGVSSSLAKSEARDLDDCPRSTPH